TTGGAAVTAGGAVNGGGRLGMDAGPEAGARFIAGPAGASGTEAGGIGGGRSVNICAEAGAETTAPKSKANTGTRRERPPRRNPPVPCLPQIIRHAFH
ncbi:MAG: hypothetical protein WAO01_07985, partial [Bradyrhizobium sp.]